MSRRKVHFSVPIHQIEYLEYNESDEADDTPYSSLYWASVAADRDRFRKRIEQFSLKISTVFDSEFRQKIYKERFQEFSPPIQTINQLNQSTSSSSAEKANTSLDTVTNSSINSSSTSVIQTSSKLSPTTTSTAEPNTDLSLSPRLIPISETLVTTSELTISSKEKSGLPEEKQNSSHHGFTPSTS